MFCRARPWEVEYSSLPKQINKKYIIIAMGVEIAMGAAPVPIYVSRGHFAISYEVPKFLARGGHLCTQYGCAHHS